MKFGTVYQEALRREEYPQQWVESAISYKKLKKCIKSVQQELTSLGLDRATLEALWQHAGLSTTGNNADRLLQYQFLDDSKAKFIPKLTIALDPCDGSPMDAWLTTDTRTALLKLGKQNREAQSQVTTESSATSENQETVFEPLDMAAQKCRDCAVEQVETIEVPLTSDSEFFQILRNELKALEALQESERSEITREIEQLGEELQVLKMSEKKQSKAELNYWREIFRLYIENQIFVSNSEHDAGIRPAKTAASHLQQFSREIAALPHSHKSTGRKMNREQFVALDRFLSINTTLLRLLSYQELNRTALSKIMKKFDKRTALHAQTTLLAPMQKRPAMTRDLARATIYTISNNLLTIIPQVDDYSCPVCSELAYKPVRLRCSHLYCIRCVVRLQRDNKDECPMCRQKVVLQATEENVDKKMQKFLKDNFPNEAKAKQRDNEHQAGVDVFGEDYNHGKCTVM
ncbi:hypothetical protein BT93_L4486 [Corymbia citriodora subsp. variegata]|uniref:Uncharacterized protein n=1 Tax=Corymbia citriodora subsp. variegata TaxID=360336 RepID=A0A8T0CKT0_CORYI|nr:hypothetical protein BT93_L4486 [Corymbia citriodora subsp. variegata]